MNQKIENLRIINRTITDVISSYLWSNESLRQPKFNGKFHFMKLFQKLRNYFLQTREKNSKNITL